MSRIGKKPLTVPSGVTIAVSGNVVAVKGPKGELQQTFNTKTTSIEVDAQEVRIARKGEMPLHRADQGLYRALVNNMLTGCSAGFRRELEINGVGYSAKVANNKLTLQIGFCHPVEMEMPEGVKIEAPSATKMIVSGADRQAVGQIAAEIRAVRPPEPYNGKGIKYVHEIIRRKAGKTVAAK